MMDHYDELVQERDNLREELEQQRSDFGDTARGYQKSIARHEAEIARLTALITPEKPKGGKDTLSPEKRLEVARERRKRPALCVGDIVKKRRKTGERRDDRLFVVLGFGPRMCGNIYLIGEPQMAHNGEDIIRIKEYKQKGAQVKPVQRKLLWFTGKQLSL